MPRGRRTWTTELSALAINLYRQTEPVLTRPAIAQRLGVTETALRVHLTRLGATRPSWTRGRGMWAPTGRVAVRTHHVWCLGASEAAHKFWSRDPKTNRICQRCDKARAGVFEEIAL